MFKIVKIDKDADFFFWTFYQFWLLGLAEEACFRDSLEWMGFEYKNKMKWREKKK